MVTIALLVAFQTSLIQFASRSEWLVSFLAQYQNKIICCLAPRSRYTTIVSELQANHGIRHSYSTNKCSSPSLRRVIHEDPDAHALTIFTFCVKELGATCLQPHIQITSLPKYAKSEAE